MQLRAAMRRRASITERVPKDLKEYLEVFNAEFDGHLKLLSISLRRQELQLEEKLAEKELVSRSDRRRVKEQLFKGSQKATIRQRSVALKMGRESEFCTETTVKSCSKYKLEEFLKRLKADKDESEDEEELINLNDNTEKELNLNNMYKEKEQEISKMNKEFQKVIEACKDKKISTKIIERLQEKQMNTIKNISDNFSKKLLS
eukprot:TRINITY_DN5657_c0_g1_i1.p2 TRINITY_DN5657_c0_g1~~TRINITY_DN5657_c0_g1_i1.p2  ORF type:complete len:203 (+),score=74.31 TRINITY_DN5657_c0_g1_i1:346-954(+)